MANKTFQDYFNDRVILTGNPPPEGDFYLVYRSGAVYKTTFAGVKGYAAAVDDNDVTTISAPDVWTPVANTLFQESITPNLSFAANTFTYAGIDQSVPSVLRASMSCIKTEATPMVYQVGIAINGTVTITHHAVTVNETEFSFVATEQHYALQSGDTVQMQVRNISGNHDLIIQDAQLSIF